MAPSNPQKKIDMTCMLKLMHICLILCVHSFEYGATFGPLHGPSQINRLESGRKSAIGFNGKQKKQKRNEMKSWNQNAISGSMEDVEKVENRAKQTIGSDNHLILSDKITRSLDIYPLIESVSRHCTTRRGRNAVLNLANNPNAQKSTRLVLPGNKSSRRMSFLGYQKVSSRVDFNDQSRTNPLNIQQQISIINISQTALETRQEYLRIDEAMHILKQSKEITDNEGKSNIKHKKNQSNNIPITTIPPIYGCDSSPWDTNKDVITDDDEWLLHTGSDHTVLDLENVIQAEQIVKTLLDTRHWADSQLTEACAPALAQIGKQINKDELEFAYEKLKNTVIIKRAETIADITGSRVRTSTFLYFTHLRFYSYISL